LMPFRSRIGLIEAKKWRGSRTLAAKTAQVRVSFETGRQRALRCKPEVLCAVQQILSYSSSFRWPFENKKCPKMVVDSEMCAVKNEQKTGIELTNHRPLSTVLPLPSNAAKQVRITSRTTCSIVTDLITD
jgi:hypothetical protein